MTPLNILLLLEDPTTAAEIRKILNEESYNVLNTTYNLNEFLRLEEQLKFDLIIMDLPGKEYFEDPSPLHKIIQDRGVAVIFLTDDCRDEFLERIREYSSYGFILKPVNRFELVHTVEFMIYKNRMELRLKESEDLHRLILENISDAIFKTDENGKFTYICPSCNILFGYSQEEIANIGNIYALVGKQFFDYKELQSKGELKNIELDIIDKNNTGHTVLVNIKNVSISEGSILFIFRDITERKQLTEKLEFQANLLNEIRDYILVTDLDGIITYANIPELNTFGPGDENLIGKSIHILGENPHQGATQKEILDATLSEGSWKGTVFNYTPQGSEIIFYSRTHLISDENGNPKGILGISTDISELKKIESQLHKKNAELEVTLEEMEQTNEELAAQNEELNSVQKELHEQYKKFRTLFELESDAIFLIEAESGNILEANQAAVDIYDYSYKELLLKKLSDLSTKTGGTLDTSSNSETYKPIQHHRKKDGTVFPVELSTQHIVYNKMDVHIVAVRDLTARITYQETLRKNEELLKESQKLAKLGGWEMDVPVGNKVWTDEIYQILEVDHDYLPSYSTDLNFFTEKSRPYIIKATEDAINGVPFDMEFECITAKGNTRWLRIIGKPLYENDIVTKIHGIAHDITERRQYRVNLQRMLDEKELLLKEIHHRVKNNMQIIGSLLNLQARNSDDTKFIDLMNVSISRIRSMAMVHEMLYKTTDFAQINIREYSKMLCSHLMTSIGEDAENFQLNIRAENILLGIDLAIPIGLLINELFSNAIKHAFPGKKGEISLSIKSERESTIELSIHDNGVGLPDNIDINNLHSLGLTIVRLLIDQINASMEIKREGGTRFIILIPLKQKF